MSSNSPQILITGATGYIGGDTLHAILLEFPHLESLISCLVRKSKHSELLRSTYPSLKLVYGDFDDLSLLEFLASSVDIVIHCANIEDVAPTKALARGLARRDRTGPAFWICTSGTDILAWETIRHGSYGEPREMVYNDMDDIFSVLALPDDAPHRDVEAAQQGATSFRVKTAIVCAPCIYGQGRGCGNQRSIQLPNLARFIIETGNAFMVGRGQNRWPNVHVHDLSNLFVRLTKEALAGGGIATWGLDGYYFAENGEHVWGRLPRKLQKKLSHKV
ncbi:hypothetical protein N7510_010728 [Penicillium lagena]|uniref:uncharacterized protein n=1 Tax=Penicillium lagena TaxID=94218 RepID=UPI0025417259|nr:uncharacterized protein N7510_010728 [Penicillium lagena]KAJ5601194.1 hypothetical protein N7510_010728 [Penicillium lagena]